MPDIFNKKKRSDVMSRIRGKGNKATELRLIKIFRTNGITGWKRGCSLALTPRSSKSQGTSSKARSTGKVKPDFVFPKPKTAVFVDGCFWHGCPMHATWPKTNAAFWRKKIRRNQERDREVGRALRKIGWKVLRIWQHALRRKDEAKLIRRLLRIHENSAAVLLA